MNSYLPKTFLVTSHTKYVGQGSTFVAIKGQKENGVTYITHALEKGATTIVVAHDELLSNEIVQALASHQAKLVRVANTRQALAQLSAQAYNFPARKLKIIAITGTKGKTTTSWMLAHFFKQAGLKTALLSTVRNRILDTEFQSELTTPQPDYIHAFLQACVAREVEWVVMETAAQAASLYRIDGIEFDGAIYTNFSSTHAEFYARVEDYFAAKKQILEQVKASCPIILNGDDSKVFALQHYFPNAYCTYENGVYRICKTNVGIAWQYAYQGRLYNFECPSLIGSFNISNFAMAITLALKCSLSISDLQTFCKTFTGVPGRLERYQLPNGASCFIDYAHTPSSFTAVLSLLRNMTQQLIVVFGAGGERDRSMRPQLGDIASTLADAIVLTMDNPRSEQVTDIITDILAGIDQSYKQKVLVEVDRARAIEKAYTISQPGAIIALLGKGPDEYQIIGTQKLPFSERAIVASFR